MILFCILWIITIVGMILLVVGIVKNNLKLIEIGGILAIVSMYLSYYMLFNKKV